MWCAGFRRCLIGVIPVGLQRRSRKEKGENGGISAGMFMGSNSNQDIPDPGSLDGPMGKHAKVSEWTRK